MTLVFVSISVCLSPHLIHTHFATYFTQYYKTKSQTPHNKASDLPERLICGDIICHHASWLGVCTSLTCHGTSAKAFCVSLGLTQSVNFPTRISTNSTLSLLDLNLTNVPENICCSSSGPIGSSDHMLVKVDISLAIIREPPQHRRVWHFIQADWQGLQAAIKLRDWHERSE